MDTEVDQNFDTHVVIHKPDDCSILSITVISVSSSSPRSPSGAEFKCRNSGADFIWTGIWLDGCRTDSRSNSALLCRELHAIEVARESFRLIIDGVDGCPPY